MSAIYGIIDMNQKIIDSCLLHGFENYYSKYKIDKMNTLNVHNVAMGCGVQFFTNEAKKEVLPFYDEYENIIYTADVVLDNREELINDLGDDSKDFSDATPLTDGLLLYRSYLKWGKDCFTHFRGVFSAAIYDGRRKEIILAVDHFSQRCLFYHVRDGRLYFSTLFFPILKETGLEFEQNERWLVDSITLRSPVMITEPKETAMKDVYKVVSGTYICFKQGALDCMEEIRYYDPNKEIPTDKSITPKQSEEMIRSAMKNAVKGILRDDVEVACQLSAGLDSSTVACIAASLLQKKKKKIRSYTSVPLKEANLPKKGYLLYDESDGVKQICKEYPNIIPTFLDTANRNYLKEVREILRLWEMPCKSQQNAIWNDEISKQAALDGCRILLNGSTGNCTLSAGQYADVIYHNITRLRFFKAIKMLGAIKFIGASRKVFLKNMSKAFWNYYLWYFDSEKRDCYKDTVTLPEVGERYQLRKRFHKTVLHFFPFANIKEYRRKMYMNEANAQIGELDTKLSLVHGILSRDPMRTVEVVNLCFQLPMECFANKDYDRRLVRVGMEDIVSEKIRHDVMHRGRQSGDNEYRIGALWDEMLPNMKKYLYSKQTLQYLSKEKIDFLFSKVHPDNMKENMMEARMLVDAYTFAVYLEMLSGETECENEK